MLSENEKDGRKAFFAANGEMPEDEAFRSGRGVALMVIVMLTIAGMAGAYYLTH
jgi:hypothetical protein